MRVSLLAVAAGLAGLLLASPPAEAATPVIGCVSLANLRLLLNQAKQDLTAAAARLGDDKMDRMGCTVLAPDAVTALTEHLSLNGQAYDCVAVKNTSLCYWTPAGSAVPPAPVPPSRKSAPAEKARR